MIPLRPALACLLLFGTQAHAQAPAETPAPPRPYTPPAASAPEPDAPADAAEAPAAAGVRADDALASMLAQLSPFVADVQIVGPWSEDGRTGIWRTVTLQPEAEGAGNRFFVQQIEEVDGTPAVSSSTEIVEVGELAGALISYRADTPDEAEPGLLTLFLDIVPLDAEIAETYELFYTAGAPYNFGPASN